MPNAMSRTSRWSAGRLPRPVRKRTGETPVAANLLHRCWLKRVAPEPDLKLLQGELTLQAMAFLAVADLAVERGQQIESDIGRLKISALGAGDVMHERPEGGCARERRRFHADGQRGGIDSGDQAGRDRFDIAFDPSDLSREHYIVMSLHLQRGQQQRRRIDIG